MGLSCSFVELEATFNASSLLLNSHHFDKRKHSWQWCKENSQNSETCALTKMPVARLLVKRYKKRHLAVQVCSANGLRGIFKFSEILGRPSCMCMCVCVCIYIYIYIPPLPPCPKGAKNMKFIVGLQHSSPSKDPKHWRWCWGGVFYGTINQECSEFTIQDNYHWNTTACSNTQQQAKYHEELLQTRCISELPTVNRQWRTFLTRISLNANYCVCYFLIKVCQFMISHFHS